MEGVSLRKGSMGDGGGRENASAPMNSNGLSGEVESGPSDSMSSTSWGSGVGLQRRGDVRLLLDSAMDD